MKIVLLDGLTLGADVDLSVFENLGEFKVFETTSKEQRAKHIGDSEVVMTNKVIIDKEIMDVCKSIKLICITATGMNNVDLEYAKQQGIVVKNVAGYSTASVAQVTFTLALSLIGQSAYYDEFVKSGSWSNSLIFTHLERPFFEIKGKTWGIIGLGTIGKEVAKIVGAFGAEIVYYSTSGANNNAEYKQVSLEELMKSDIISIHAPLNEQTKNLITKEQLSMMQKGSVIINVGRGGIIDESDLAWAIDEHAIKAGVDVTAIEPPSKENPLLHVKHKERLIFSPHIAWASVESRRKLIELVAKNIIEYTKN